MSYIQFLFKSKNKNIADINKLDLENFALSYGLQNAPTIQLKRN